MKYFVSGDIHGFYDEWQNALKDKTKLDLWSKEFFVEITKKLQSV